MSNTEQLMREWLKKGQELLDAQEGSAKEAALESRLAEIESRLAGKPKAEVEEAAEELELDDDEYQLILEHRKGKQNPETEPVKEETPPEPRVAKTRPGRKSGQAYPWTVDDTGRVTRTDLPFIYNGPDEADEVELPEEEAVA